MPQQEEVNAWASYEQTARTPRRLSAVTLRQRRQIANISASRHRNVDASGHLAVSASRHSPSIDLSYLSGEFVAPRQATERPFFQQALSLREQQGKSTARLNTGQRGLRLDDAILKKIRATFHVFFEGTSSSNDDEIEKPSPSSSSQSSLSEWLASTNATMPWIQTTFQNPVLLFLDLCLRGIGQVVFQNSPLTGLLILIGLLIQSPRVAFHGVLALVITNGVALLLGFDKGLASSGLFGYNAVLVGLALATFDANQEHLAATLILGSVGIASFTSILFVTMGKLLVPYKSPPLTLPFNVATLLFLLSAANMGRVHYGSVRGPALPNYYSENDDQDFSITAAQFFGGTIRGLGQVFLADHLAAGFLVLIGMAFCSRISAAAALVGSALGAAMAVATGVPAQAIEVGLYGFNPCLSVAAMFMFYTPSLGAGILAVFAGVITVVAQQALATLLEPWGLPFMTLPFCVVSLPFIIIQGTTSVVVAVPLASMTVPEDHLRVVNMLADGFDFLKEALMDTSDTIKAKSSSRQMHSRTLTKSLSVLSDALDQAEEAHNGSSGDAGTNATNQKALWGDESLQETKQAALQIYQALLKGKPKNELPISHIADAFQAAGLNDNEALSFASLILTFIDLDDSGTIDKAEFVAFALVCSAMHTIRAKIVQFFEFVDENGNGRVSFEEIDAALQYLGQPVLDDASKERLLELTRIYGYGQAEESEDDGEMDVMELVNAVTVAKVKAFTGAFHGCDSTANLSNNVWSERKQEEDHFSGVKEFKTEAEYVDVEC